MLFITNDNRARSILFTLGMGILLAATSGCTAADIEEEDLADVEDVAEATQPIVWNGHVYWFRPEPVAWTTARNACAAKGYYLATINNQTEQDWINTQLANQTGNWWIGYNDRVTEGVFSWVAGGSIFNYWQAGEPNDSANNFAQDCVAMTTPSGRWYDLGCGSLRNYLCEKTQ